MKYSSVFLTQEVWLPSIKDKQIKTTTFRSTRIRLIAYWNKGMNIQIFCYLLFHPPTLTIPFSFFLGHSFMHTILITLTGWCWMISKLVIFEDKDEVSTGKLALKCYFQKDLLWTSNPDHQIPFEDFLINQPQRPGVPVSSNTKENFSGIIIITSTDPRKQWGHEEVREQFYREVFPFFCHRLVKWHRRCITGRVVSIWIRLYL